MIRKEYYKSCDLFITNEREKIKKELTNEYGYNISPNIDRSFHYEAYAKTNQNNLKRKPKR